MRGLYEIVLSSRRVKYEMTIRRNLTIVKGDSATGKTTLVEMVAEYERNGAESGISISCEKECVVLAGRRWEERLAQIRDSIVFIAEDHRFVASEDFARAIHGTDNYYVIVTREPLENLPYSVDEVYGIRTSGKYGGLVPAYHEFYHIYDTRHRREEVAADSFLIEDSNAGYDFFRSVVTQQKRPCFSANGKSNVFRWLLAHPSKCPVVIADGAAFGSQMERMEMLKRSGYRFVLYLPESFEWLILSSGLVDGRHLAEILKRPENFIESAEYISWERFFTQFLVDLTQRTVWQYQKRHLNPIYLHEGNAQKILALLPPTIREEDD